MFMYEIYLDGTCIHADFDFFETYKEAEEEGNSCAECTFDEWVQDGAIDPSLYSIDDLDIVVKEV